MLRFLSFLLFCLFAAVAFAQTGELTVTISGMRNDEGTCRASLFNNEKGFPGESQNAIRTMSSTITGGSCTFVLTGLPAGDYAVAVMHDENNNKKMDTNFFGIPTEGHGASNNPKSSFGPPEFNEAKIKLTGNSNVFIAMRYF